MKTSRISKLVVGGVATSSLLIVSSLLAGPGPQYWQAAAKTNGAPAPEKVAVNVAHVCPGAQTVPITAMKPSWPNGRGPLVTVQTGTRTMCYTCPVTNTVTANAWSNGRGPTTRTEVVQTGVAHDCTTGCGPVAAR